MDIAETLKLIDKFPKISGEMEGNSGVVIDLLYRYHFNEFLRSTDTNISVDENLMILTNSYCQRNKHKPANEFGDLILDIASTGIACPTKKLFIVLHVIQSECTDIHMNFKLRLAYLGLTHDFNQLELKKADVDCDSYDIMAAEAELSEFFVFLSDVLCQFPEIYRECMLTAFTLNPSEQLYQKLKHIASSHGLDGSNGMPSGSIPAITNTGYLVSHNYNPFESPNCIMDTNEIDIDVREDLSRAITHPRLKFISWGMPYDEFCEICVKLMSGQKEDFLKNVVASANDSLEYVDIDFSRFKDLPEKEGDDGIEKGYHIFLDDDDSSEEDDDKTMTSPEAAELIKEAEIKLKKRKMVLKRKSTICKKLMKNGVPTKKILMKAPPRKIPRPPNCNRIDWKHIEELKEYFKEHSHLIKATQMFNDAQALIDKLTEMSGKKEQPTSEQNCTNTAMGAVTGDLNLNIIPIDPDSGIVVNNLSSSTEHENFPNTSLVLPNSIDQDTHITNTSNITAANLPTLSTSMTLQNLHDPVAVITSQLLQLLDDVDAELRLHYRRQKNYLASIKRKKIKSGFVDVDKTNIDSKANQEHKIGSITDENITLDLPFVSNSSNIPSTEEYSKPSDVKPLDVEPLEVKIEDVKKENLNELPTKYFENVSSVSTALMNFTPFTETAPYQSFIEDSKDFVNAYSHPITEHSFIPNPTNDNNLQSLPTFEQAANNYIGESPKANHYDEIINMVASACVDQMCDQSIEKPKATKKRKKQCAIESSLPTIPQNVNFNNTGAPVEHQTYESVEANGFGQYKLPDDVPKPKIKKNRKKSSEPATDIVCDPNTLQSKPADGETEIKVTKKPRKPRGKNKPKIPKSDSDKLTAETTVRSEGDPNQLTPDMVETKKVKTPRAPRVKVPRLDSSDGDNFTPNCKLSDLPDDFLNEKGRSYMDSIERAIQRVMAGDISDIQPGRSGNQDEMTMMEIDGVLDNILNMNNGVLVNRDESKVCFIEFYLLDFVGTKQMFFSFSVSRQQSQITIGMIPPSSKTTRKTLIWH